MGVHKLAVCNVFILPCDVGYIVLTGCFCSSFCFCSVLGLSQGLLVLDH